MKKEINVGDDAPLFDLPANNNHHIDIANFLDKKHIVLYFYPKDMTPGCTQEAIAFRDLQNEFEMAEAVILGVSTDNTISHNKFALQHNLTFPILSDEDGEIASLYCCLNQNGMAKRTTFVIDKEGIVVAKYPNVKVECHADEILTFLRIINR